MNIWEMELANRNPYFNEFEDDALYFDGRKDNHPTDNLSRQIAKNGSINAKRIA